jgi:hypothetical protein
MLPHTKTNVCYSFPGHGLQRKDGEVHFLCVRTFIAHTMHRPSLVTKRIPLRYTSCRNASPPCARMRVILYNVTPSLSSLLWVFCMLRVQSWPHGRAASKYRTGRSSRRRDVPGRVVEHGVARILDSGSWIRGPGFWILDSGSRALDAGVGILDSGSWVLDSGSWIPDAGFGLLDSGS